MNFTSKNEVKQHAPRPDRPKGWGGLLSRPKKPFVSRDLEKVLRYITKGEGNMTDRELLERVFEEVKEMRKEINARLDRLEQGQKLLNDRLFETEREVNVLKEVK